MCRRRLIDIFFQVPLRTSCELRDAVGHRYKALRSPLTKPWIGLGGCAFFLLSPGAVCQNTQARPSSCLTNRCIVETFCPVNLLLKDYRDSAYCTVHKKHKKKKSASASGLYSQQHLSRAPVKWKSARPPTHTHSYTGCVVVVLKMTHSHIVHDHPPLRFTSN